LYFHCAVASLLGSLFDEKLRERRGPRFALEKGITECRKFESYNVKLDIYSVHIFIIHHDTYLNFVEKHKHMEVHVEITF